MFTGCRMYSSIGDKLRLTTVHARWLSLSRVSCGAVSSTATTASRMLRHVDTSRCVKSPGILQTYTIYAATQRMLEQCTRVADYTIPGTTCTSQLNEIPKNALGQDIGTGYGWWFEDLKLEPTFSAWARVTFLHMYMLCQRFRTFAAPAATAWHKQLVEHFTSEADARMKQRHRLMLSSVRAQYTRDLYLQWRGSIVAYDEGFIRGDAVLAAAVWRNLLGGMLCVDMVKLAQIVAYIRRNMATLDAMSDEELMMGRVKFTRIEEEKSLVLVKSRLMSDDLTS